jgi:hypothetical protein
MKKYLVDSNIIIDHSQREEKATRFLESLEEITVSAVTVAEIYQGCRNKTELASAKEFFGRCQILPLDQRISELALGLVETYLLSHGLLILDALIAATALRHGLVLKTGNDKHFRFVKKLKIEN